MKKSVSMFQKKKAPPVPKPELVGAANRFGFKSKPSLPIKKGKSAQSQLSTATNSSMRTRIGRSVDGRKNNYSRGLMRGVKKTLAQKSVARI